MATRLAVVPRAQVTEPFAAEDCALARGCPRLDFHTAYRAAHHHHACLGLGPIPCRDHALLATGRAACTAPDRMGVACFVFPATGQLFSRVLVKRLRLLVRPRARGWRKKVPVHQLG